MCIRSQSIQLHLIDPLQLTGIVVKVHFLVIPLLDSLAPMATRLFITDKMFLKVVFKLKFWRKVIINNHNHISCSHQCQSEDGPQTGVQDVSACLSGPAGKLNLNQTNQSVIKAPQEIKIDNNQTN